jgi:hypothetical protein
VRRSWLTNATSRRRDCSAARSESRISASHTVRRAWYRPSITAAGIVTIDTMTSTTAVCSNVPVTMKPLAPSTPASVASTGISTSATMLTASDQVRASRMTAAPASTTGTEQASAHPMISQKSAVGIRPPGR